MKKQLKTFWNNYKIPLILSGITVLITFVWALNQKYIFDWDACFRSFTAFAGRDIIIEFFKGNVSSLNDIKLILTKYSDFYEARPGSLVSYPPGQTFIIGIMSFISTNQFFLSLFNVFCFFMLSLGIWKAGDKLSFSISAKLVTWSIVCLHPTILITIWSLRRGLFEAAALIWCIIFLLDFFRNMNFKYFLYLVITVTYGFLYRETLAVVALPVAVVFFLKIRSIKWEFRKNYILIIIALSGIFAASIYSAGQYYLYSKGRLSIFDKPGAYVIELGGGPPEEILTMYGYYKGQFAPEKYAGMREKELKDAGAPEVYRLAKGRWALPTEFKFLYVLSMVFVNPLTILFSFILLFYIRSLARDPNFLICISFGLIYFMMLAPMGGIPDYITPVIVSFGLTIAFIIKRFNLKFNRISTISIIITNSICGMIFLIGFALGHLEEYPPRYDYDHIIEQIANKTGDDKFGIAIDNYWAKNLAYSKLNKDKDSKIAVYSMNGGRLPLSKVLKPGPYSRFSPILNFKREVPAVDYLIFTGIREKEVWEKRLASMGYLPPYWVEEECFKINGEKRLFLGKFKPVYVYKINKKRYKK